VAQCVGVTSPSIYRHFAQGCAAECGVREVLREARRGDATLVSKIVFRMKGASRAPICSWISGDIGVDAVDPAKHVRGQELVMVGGEMPVEPSAQLISQLLYLRRRRLKERIHGRPRSDRKRRFLLSAVALSTNSRHPREARPINWAQCGGLASGREMSPDAEATFHRTIMDAW
jgi:hypothetical protein